MKWHCPKNCSKMPAYDDDCPDDLGPGEPCPKGIFDEDEEEFPIKTSEKCQSS